MKKGIRPTILVAAMLLAVAVIAEAQQPKKIARLGYLCDWSAAPPTLTIYKAELRGLGWIEGKQIEFEDRYAAGDFGKLSDFATELIAIEVDVILAGPDNLPTVAAKRATTMIPIVMVGVVDPVVNGLIASLARPGANVTGVTYEVTREQGGKNLELLKEAVPQVSRVAILRNPNVSAQISYSREAERAAKSLGVTIQFADVQAQNDKGLEDALNGIMNKRANGLLVTPYSFFADRRHRIIDFTARNKLPTIYFGGGFVNDGGLMSYGPNQEDMWRLAAKYVDKILVDLPVEQPKKFGFAINLKTAKQIGLIIPPNVLARADRVIK